MAGPLCQKGYLNEDQSVGSSPHSYLRLARVLLSRVDCSTGSVASFILVRVGNEAIHSRGSRMRADASDKC